MQFLCELFMKLVKKIKCMGESYTSYIKRLLSCDFQITLKNGNIDGGGGECNFLIDNLERKLFVTSVTHKLLPYY